jgi:hypothetical protein
MAINDDYNHDNKNNKTTTTTQQQEASKQESKQASKPSTQGKVSFMNPASSPL